ncbi:MAG: helix-turn-helix transcriptional regulator [Tyzzerella sp.]|nr:helix-turn-helix transcriptional regulator [Tyzzerella sp.]
MKKDTIGAILKNRIKEMGYTQEDFAEKAGIGLASLKKYINGTNVYKVDLLPIFADLLECSYDYLLGYSRSPIRENSDISNELHLSDESIRLIRKMASLGEDDYYYMSYFYILNSIIENEDLMFALVEYVVQSRYIVNQMQPILDEIQKPIVATIPFETMGMKTDTMFMLMVVNELNRIRENKPQELRDLINQMAQDENIENMKEIIDEKAQVFANSQNKG